MAHPAKLVSSVRRTDALLAAEFAAEVELAVAEPALTRGEGGSRLRSGSEEHALAPTDEAHAEEPYRSPITE
jgi:hypothetical protein